MSKDGGCPPCSMCPALMAEIARLEARIARLERKIKLLERHIEKLELKLAAIRKQARQWIGESKARMGRGNLPRAAWSYIKAVKRSSETFLSIAKA